MTQENDLLSRFDADPGRWRPMFYNVKISVPVLVNQSGVGSVPLNNQPYIMKAIRHCVVGKLDRTADYSGSGLYDDGQYDIEFKDEQSNYQNIGGPALIMFGSRDEWTPLPYPIPYNGNRVITFRLTNLYTRTLDPRADYFQVALSISGLADWGTLQTSRP